MGQLDNLHRRLSGETPDKDVVVQLFEGMLDQATSGAMAANENVLKRITTLENTLRREMGQSGSASTEKVFDALEDVVKALASAQQTVVSQLSQRIDSLEKHLSGGLTVSDLRRLEKSVKKAMPELDLSAVQQALDGLARREPEKLDLTPVLQKLESREWEFEVHREDFSDRITKVTARPV